MFEKLLAVLPYNPGLAHQVAFYGRRMREESAIRRTGMIFIVLAFMIQFFAVLSPPQTTSAAVDNDMVTGGFSSKSEAKNKCQNNVRDYGKILEYYGISCEAIGKADTVNLASNSHGGQLYSMGHNAEGARNPTTGRITNDQVAHVPGVGNMHVRLLDSWGTTTYQALHVNSSNGKSYWLLFNCGNLVGVGVPVPIPQKDFCPNKPGRQDSADQCDECPKVAGVQTNTNQCDVCPDKAGVQSTPEQCDVCTNKPGIQTKEKQCDECPNKPGVQIKDAQCDVCKNKNGIQTKEVQCDVCPNKAGIQLTKEQCDVCPGVEGVQLTKDECDVCPDLTGAQTTADQCDVCTNIEGLQTDVSECVTPCIYDATLPSNDPNCKPCDSSLSSEDTTACVVIHKTGSNITAGIADANGSTANPNDIITYSLFAQNNGKATVSGFIFQEGLSDVAAYADVTDLHGGTMDDSHNVTWPAVDIPSGQTVSVQVTVKVKDPVPQDAAGVDDPTFFDLTMTNVYGNTVDIHVPGSPEKTIETTATTLPNTGPGTTIFIGAMIVMTGGYFYGRARLLAKESNLALQESTGV